MKAKPVIEQCASVFDVAARAAMLQGKNADALRRLYAFTAGEARCNVGPELAAKYGMEQDNRQLVVSCTNRATLEQAWFNEARTRKPQTFKADGAGVVDPTDGGRRCDFCSWQTLTAEDTWGRVERPHAVTGSNLFKYGEPAHGLVLFKHHDPLAFTREQLFDFLAVSDGWFAAAAAAHGGSSVAAANAVADGGAGNHHRHAGAALHPFFIWNCGPRAGASQYHGHGQLMLTSVPVPAQARLDQQASLHAAAHQQQSHCGNGSSAIATGSSGTAGGGSVCYYRDLIRAHAAVGLARKVVVPRPQPAAAVATGGGSSASNGTSNGTGHSSPAAATATAAATADPGHDVAWVLAHLAPQKDMEVIVISGGSSSSSDASGGSTAGSGGDHRSGSGGGLSSPAFVAALHASLRGLIDGLGVQTFNCGVMNVPLQPLQPEQAPATAAAGTTAATAEAAAAAAAVATASSAYGGCSSAAPSLGVGEAEGLGGEAGCWLGLPPLAPAGGAPWRPLMARLVSRGKWAAPASDFGCLEVVGHASIGHTDPFVLMRAIDEQLAAAGVAAVGRPEAA